MRLTSSSNRLRNGSFIRNLRNNRIEHPEGSKIRVPGIIRKREIRWCILCCGRVDSCTVASLATKHAGGDQPHFHTRPTW